MEAMKDHNELASAVADISAEQSQYEANLKKEAVNKFKAKSYKKRKDTTEFYIKKNADMPSLSNTMDKFSTG